MKTREERSTAAARGGYAVLDQYGRAHFRALASRAAKARSPRRYPTFTELQESAKGRQVIRRLTGEFGPPSPPKGGRS